MSDILGRSAFREDLEKDRPDFFEVARKWDEAQAAIRISIQPIIIKGGEIAEAKIPNLQHWHDDVHVMD
jgi:hypothetical protein